MDSKLSLSAKRQLWRERYDEFKQSGLTQAEYCRQHGLPVRALSYWVRKYGNQQAHPARILGFYYLFLKDYIENFHL